MIKDAGEREAQFLSIGITSPWLSTIVFHALHRPIEILPESTEIQGCLPVLLSVLLSARAQEKAGGDAVCSV